MYWQGFEMLILLDEACVILGFLHSIFLFMHSNFKVALIEN